MINYIIELKTGTKIAISASSGPELFNAITANIDPKAQINFYRDATGLLLNINEVVGIYPKSWLMGKEH